MTVLILPEQGANPASRVPATVTRSGLVRNTASEGASAGAGNTSIPAEMLWLTRPSEAAYGKKGSCFVAGTAVKLASGLSACIEDIKMGDILLGEDNSHNKVLEFDHPMLDGRKLYSINGSAHFVTEEHPFKTTSGWKSISHQATTIEDPHIARELKVTSLEPGDILMCDGGEVLVLELSEIDNAPDQRVYNFKLSGNNTYYANGYLVHNKTSGGSTTTNNDEDIPQDEEAPGDSSTYDPDIPGDDFSYTTTTTTSTPTTTLPHDDTWNPQFHVSGDEFDLIEPYRGL